VSSCLVFFTRRTFTLYSTFTKRRKENEKKKKKTKKKMFSPRGTTTFTITNTNTNTARLFASSKSVVRAATKTTTTKMMMRKNLDRSTIAMKSLGRRGRRRGGRPRGDGEKTRATNANNDVTFKHLPGKIILQGENNLEVTPAIRAYVEEKLGKAVSNADPRDVREIDCRVASRGGADHATKGAHICTTKATVLTRAGQIEVSEEHEDLYASIDKVADGLKRQLRKYSEKREGNARGKKEEILMAAGMGEDDEDEIPPAA
tara:strand:- start:1382 stop:2161 length:780 start_codon:yes stop_codon:yes gene_type:complete